jgi:hypothetical protein
MVAADPEFKTSVRSQELVLAYKKFVSDVTTFSIQRVNIANVMK